PGDSLSNEVVATAGRPRKSASAIARSRNKMGPTLNVRRRNPMLIRIAITVLIAAALLVSAATPLWAHHAFAAEFDAKQPVKFKGVVTKMEWTNPHVWIHLDVKQPDGSSANWSVEAG